MSITKPLRLGDLERDVLDFIWSSGSSTAKQVHESLGARRGNTLNTIQSTLDRLYKKGLLDRSKVRHAWCYSAASERADILARKFGELADELSRGEISPMLSAFVEFSARLDSNAIEELSVLVEEYRQRSGGRHS